MSQPYECDDGACPTCTGVYDRPELLARFAARFDLDLSLPGILAFGMGCGFLLAGGWWIVLAVAVMVLGVILMTWEPK